MFIVLIQGQEIPNEIFLFQRKKMLIDSGDNWLIATTFGPIRFKRLAEYNPGNDSLKIDLRIFIRAPKITVIIKYPRSEAQLGPALYIGLEYDLVPLLTMYYPPIPKKRRIELMTSQITNTSNAT